MQRMNLIVALSLLVTSLSGLAANETAEANLAADRFLVVSRTFPEKIFISKDDIPVGKTLRETLDISLMSAKSLQQLSDIHGVEIVQSFAQEKRQSRVDKQEFMVWGVSDKFLKEFGLANNSLRKIFKKESILVSSKTMQRLAWKQGEVKALVESSPMHRELSGPVYGFDSVLTETLVNGDNLMLVPFEDMLRDAPPGIMNPRVLIRLKQNVNVNVVKERIESFLVKEAQPTLRGSILQLKSLNAYDH